MPDIRINREVAEKEIVGTWRLDPGSTALASNDFGGDYVPDASQPNTIVFNPDGTCRYRSVSQMPTRHIDESGEWSIVPTSDKPERYEIKMTLKMEGGGTSGFDIGIRERSGELVLWQFWGDPDSWHFLEYRRSDP